MQTGSVVLSKAGGDSGKMYLVLGFDAKGYALIADGKRHGKAAPKKKNVKHLSDTGVVWKIPKTDAAIVTAIRRFRPSESGVDPR